MKTFVTGGAGFLGRHVVRRLLDAGQDVRCLVRSHASSGLDDLRALPGAERLEFVYGSLQDQHNLADLIAGCDRIIHIAAAVKGSAPTLFLDTVVGTRALVAAAVQARVDRFVLVSSIAVYGSQQLPVRAVLDETCPLDPQPHLRDPYTYSKIAQEDVCWEASRNAGLPLVVIRPGVIYGPGRPVITNRVGLGVGSLLVQMGGGHQLPYTYVENCAEAVFLAGTTAGIGGRAFNVVDDGLPTGRQIVRACRRSGMRLRVVPIPRLFINAAVATYEYYSNRSKQLLPPVLTRYKANAQWRPLRFSNQLAKQELRWAPRVSTAQGVAAALASAPQG